MRQWILSAAVAAVLLGASLSRGMFMNNSVKIPVDRATANVERWIKDKPNDAQGYYVLARIHAMAWAYGPDLNLWGAGGGRAGRGGAATAPDADPFGGQLPGFAPYDSIEVRRDAQKKDATADDIKHLEESIRNYRKAVELDPKNALYELGLAWVLQESGKISLNLPLGFAGSGAEVSDADKARFRDAISKLGNADPKVREDATALLQAAMPAPLAELRGTRNDNLEAMTRIANIISSYWELQALDHYRKAYTLRIDQDLKGGGGLRAGDSALAQEAGEAILGILKNHPEAAAANEARDVAANVQTLRNKPMAVTPIVFAMPGAADDAAQVGDLVDSAKRVSFDLAGDQVARTWPWLKDGTALLVWDPARTGAITSGRQLFGDHTWWVFFRNGYEALSVLDDNRDGILSGDELQGISVWIDKNGDAVSQPGEVITLREAGVVSLGVHFEAAPDGTLKNSAGVRFSDGRTVPTFDWVTLPVVETSAPRP